VASTFNIHVAFYHLSKPLRASKACAIHPSNVKQVYKGKFFKAYLTFRG